MWKSYFDVNDKFVKNLGLWVYESSIFIIITIDSGENKKSYNDVTSFLYYSFPSDEFPN